MKIWWAAIPTIISIWVNARADWTDKAPHKAGLLTVNNVKLHYLDWGGKGDTLLFLHGMGDTAHIYDNLAPKFTNQFRVLGLTRRGHGESEIPNTGYDTATLVEDIRQFLDALKIQRVVLAGHSFAGDELTRLAVVHPDRVIKLIYFDSAYDHSRVPESLRFKPLHGASPEVLPTKEESESLNGTRRWIDRLFGEKMGRAIYQMMESTYSAKAEYGNIKAPALAFFVVGYQKDFDRAETLPEPQRHDFQALLKAQRKYHQQEIEHFRKEIPNGRAVILTNADHACFIDREDEVVREMRRFLIQFEKSVYADSDSKSGSETPHIYDEAADGSKQIADADWPQWRGPNRDGTWNESVIISSFASTGLNPKWKLPVGFGYSTPIVSKGKLYVSDLVVEKSNIFERVLCFNASSGKRVWMTQHSTSAPDWFFNPAQMRGPGSTPVIHNGRVYALSMFFVLKCLDARTGTVIWKRDLATEYQLPPSSLDASPLVDRNLLIVPIGGKPAAGVVAFDLLSGREVWKALDQAATWSSPVIVFAGGTRQLIVWMRQSVTSLNPTNGALYWSEPFVSGGSPGFSAVSTPVIHGDRLLVSGLMFQLDRDRPAAKVLWPDTTSGTRRILSDTSTPLFRDDYVYCPRSGGLFVCLEASTGREVWQTNIVTNLRQGACVHLIPNGTSVFLFTDQGDLVRAQLTPAGYRELGRVHLIDPTSPLFENKFAWAAPAFANRNIYVRNDRELLCYSLVENSDGQKRGKKN